ncbi:MAG: N-acetyltransferase [Planctomycetota bacterium]|nr:MAG: N-acetyltransferase [Planctomycetota bacterium]
MTSPCLRLATEDDLVAINDIYNYYVLHSTCTYQLEAEPIEDRAAWFRERLRQCLPVTVAEHGTQVVGWGSLSRFHPRTGYASTVEASVYINHQHHRRGLGRLLLSDLVERARSAGFHSVIGGASAEQTASIALQESLGFKRVGQLVQVGYKFNTWLDVIYLQRMLGPASPEQPAD